MSDEAYRTCLLAMQASMLPDDHLRTALLWKRTRKGSPLAMSATTLHVRVSEGLSPLIIQCPQQFWTVHGSKNSRSDAMQMK